MTDIWLEELDDKGLNEQGFIRPLWAFQYVPIYSTPYTDFEAYKQQCLRAEKRLNVKNPYG